VNEREYPRSGALGQDASGVLDLVVRKDCHHAWHVLVSPVHVVRGRVLDDMSRLHQVLILAVAFFVQSLHNVGHVTVRLHDVEYDTVEGYLVITEVHIGRHARIPANDPRNHATVPDEDVFADKGVECWVWVRGHGSVSLFASRRSDCLDKIFFRFFYY